MAGSGSADRVRAFCAAWEARDLDGVLSFFHEDVVYQNVPRPPFVGKAAAGAYIGPILLGASRIEFEILALAVGDDGRTVLTERIDRLHYENGVVVIPLMGVFELDEDGRIAAWRDYVDSGHVAQQMAALRSRGGSSPP